ncbi:cell wall-binding repeat-containing protein [Clostridium drakei]|uniref:Peptidase C1A papain C-terminal domain-containing protein n=1 Tax=Clostridium drakei TaxID=332101 RepID=A0A2U8DLE5_9CLOT|nr:cell wall-binding repeat-containing protein [Clostridium drakei]AWI03547.1 hypothetical protein B9W14_03300 [Clostridium drakei]
MKSKIIKVNGHDIKVLIDPPDIKTFKLPAKSSNETTAKFINENKLKSSGVHTKVFSDGNTYLNEYEILKPKDQKDVGSCTAHSLSYNLEMAYARKHNNEYLRFSTDFIYGNREVYDEYEMSMDEGLDISDAICHLIKYGDVPYSVLDSNTEVNDAVDTVKTYAAYYKVQAYPYRILGAIDIQKYSTNDIKNLMTYQDVVIQCAIKFTSIKNNVFITEPNEELKYHSLCLVGWGNDGWKVFNSWGGSKNSSIYTIPFDYGYFTDLYAILLSGIDNVEIDDYASPNTDVYKGYYKETKGYFNSRANAIKYLERVSSPGSHVELSGGIFTKPRMGFVYKAVPLKHADIITGYNMEDQAIQVAQRIFNSNYAGVIIANKNDFPDIIAATTLSYQKKYPIIVTDNTSLSSQNKQFIQNASDRKLIILGGTSLLSDSLFSNLGVFTTRVFGADRYASAVAIGDNLKLMSETAILLNGDDYPDGICLSGYAASYEYTVSQNPTSIPDRMVHVPYPILYTTNGSSLNADTKVALKKWDIKNVIVVGSTSLIPSSQEIELNNMNITTTRLIGGYDRYNSSAVYANNSSLFKDRDGAILVDGSSFDRYAFAGILSAWIKWPVLLCTGTSFDSRVKDYIDSIKRQTKYNIYTNSPSGTISQVLLNYLDN